MSCSSSKSARALTSTFMRATHARGAQVCVAIASTLCWLVSTHVSSIFLSAYSGFSCFEWLTWSGPFHSFNSCDMLQTRPTHHPKCRQASIICCCTLSLCILQILLTKLSISLSRFCHRLVCSVGSFSNGPTRAFTSNLIGVTNSCCNGIVSCANVVSDTAFCG